jgi:hypothetical protein
MDVPETKGSGYIGHHGPDFVNFNDRWSQILNFRYDQDGSVYLIDWYDKNQCHHNNVEGHDRSNGRIYKIVYNNQKKTSVDLAKLTTDELVKLVPSRNEWMSRHARRLLQERQPESTRDALKEIALNGADTAARLRGLWAMHLVKPLDLEDARQLLASSDEWVRGWTLQLLGEVVPTLTDDIWASDGAQGAVRGIAAIAHEDKSPLVRRYVASLVIRMPVAQRWEPLAELVAHAEDAADPNLPLLYWYAAEGAVASEPDRAVGLLRSCRIPKVREYIARRLAALTVATNP